MNVKEAATLLSYVVATMPNIQDKDLAPTAKLWANVMPDISFELGQQAIIKILRSKKIPTVPLPAEVIETVDSIRYGENRINAPSDYEAWQEVRSKIDFYKPNQKWSHPAIEETIKIIGSRNICGGDYNVADRFMKVYNRIVKRSNDQYENKVTLQIIDSTSKKDKKNDLLTFIGENKQMVLGQKVV